MNFNDKQSILNEIDCIKRSIKKLEEKLNKIDVDMLVYKISLKDYKVKIPCSHCLKNGEIDFKCNKCGGKGIHDKTKQEWRIDKKKIKIDRITEKNGKVLYWVDKSEYYRKSDGYVFENKGEAQHVCDIRNAISC